MPGFVDVLVPLHSHRNIARPTLSRHVTQTKCPFSGLLTPGETNHTHSRKSIVQISTTDRDMPTSLSGPSDRRNPTQLPWLSIAPVLSRTQHFSILKSHSNVRIYKSTAHPELWWARGELRLRL